MGRASVRRHKRRKAAHRAVMKRCRRRDLAMTSQGLVRVISPAKVYKGAYYVTSDLRWPLPEWPSPVDAHILHWRDLRRVSEPPIEDPVALQLWLDAR